VQLPNNNIKMDSHQERVNFIIGCCDCRATGYGYEPVNAVIMTDIEVNSLQPPE
jgi:hypothetical protein